MILKVDIIALQIFYVIPEDNSDEPIEDLDDARCMDDNGCDPKTCPGDFQALQGI